MTRFQFSSVHSWVYPSLPPIPALLKRAIEPAVSHHRLRDHRVHVAPFRDVAFDEDRARAAFLTSLSVSLPASSTTSASTSFAPSRAKIFEVARPIPEPAPVIIATLPSNIAARWIPPLSGCFL